MNNLSSLSKAQYLAVISTILLVLGVTTTAFIVGFHWLLLGALSNVVLMFMLNKQITNVRACVGKFGEVVANVNAGDFETRITHITDAGELRDACWNVNNLQY